MFVASDALGRLHWNLLNHCLVLSVHRHRPNKSLHRWLVIASDHDPLRLVLETLLEPTSPSAVCALLWRMPAQESAWQRPLSAREWSRPCPVCGLKARFNKEAVGTYCVVRVTLACINEQSFSIGLGMVTGSDDNALWCCSHFALSQNWPGVEPITESPKLCGALTADLTHSADTDKEGVCSGAHARRFAEPSRPTAPPQRKTL